MRKFILEFKEFISKSNAIDMAVGIIFGTATNTLVKSLVNDIIMPIISGLTFKVNLKDLKFVFNGSNGLITINYGNFLQILLDFFIMAFCVFIILKFVNRLRRKRTEKKVEEFKESDESKLLKEILTVLKEKV